MKESDFTEMDRKTSKKFSIEEVVEKLPKHTDDPPLCLQLSAKSELHMERKIPFLLVYRVSAADGICEAIVRATASYLIIADEDLAWYQDLLFAIGDTMSAVFESFLILEVTPTPDGNPDFVIQGPVEKTKSTLELLHDRLRNIALKYPALNLDVKLQNKLRRSPGSQPPLLDVEQLKNSGVLLLVLEIPPVYKNQEEQVYPVFFRQFRDLVVQALYAAIFNFVRVQTNGQVRSAYALDRGVLSKQVYHIDEELAKMETSYRFLWLIAPSNIQQLRHDFFQSGFEKTPVYHYRLLPIDPDILKRRLWNLQLEDIDDPAISMLFREKREELDLQISMLNERSSKNFFYNSVRLYRVVEPELYQAALDIVENIPEKSIAGSQRLIGSTAFSKMALEEFRHFKNQNEQFQSQVFLRKDVNIMMVSQGELYIPEEQTITEAEARALIQHEVGTHVLTYFNGSLQPLKQLRTGLANYEPLQEGLAVLSEYFSDGLTGNRLRTLAGRVIAGKARIDGAGFVEIFRLLNKEHGYEPDRAFNIVSRIMQGGGFLKDVIYLRGLVALQKYLREGGDFEMLLSGKFALKHVPVMRQLRDRNIIKAPAIRPTYLKNKNIKAKMELIKNGLPITQMISE